MSEVTKATVLYTEHAAVRPRVCKTVRLTIMQPGNYRSIPESIGVTAPPGWFKPPASEELPVPTTYTSLSDDRAMGFADDPTAQQPMSPLE